jgi:4'-phosphopantetheinyl transferase
MNTDFSINDLDVHLWRAYLPNHQHELENLLATLSPDEVDRANHFRFPKHRERFIIARGLLRQILGLYTGAQPTEIEFSYNAHGKPYLSRNLLNLHFNTSHSEDMAVYSLSQRREIGIDIEKVEPNFKINVAKRFFNSDEFTHLMSRPQNKQATEFYALWSRKESIIKALGQGLFTPMESFSVLQKSEYCSVNHHNEEYHFHLANFNAHPDYQAAFAVQAPIKNIYYWEWLPNGPGAWR